MVPGKIGGVPFAVLTDDVRYWPVKTEHPQARLISFIGEDGAAYGAPGRAFGAQRSGGRRYHAGHDCYGYPDDQIIAPGDGVITGHHHFYSGTHALYLKLATVTLNLGEVKAGSWEEFGLAVGSEVEAGAPVARVGRLQSGSYMLHLEIYDTSDGAHINSNQQWWVGQTHGRLLNPAEWLMDLNARDAAQAPMPTLRVGDTGEMVLEAQRRLNQALAIPADGTFDEDMARRVRWFQAAHGLKDDAIIGARTWQALDIYIDEDD